MITFWKMKWKRLAIKLAAVTESNLMSSTFTSDLKLLYVSEKFIFTHMLEH